MIRLKVIAGLTIIVVPLIVLSALHRQADTKPLDPVTSLEVEVGKGGRLLTVPITLHGRTFQFLLDTGAAKTIFDVRLQSELERTTGRAVLATSAGESEFEVFACPEAKLGEWSVRPIETVVCCDLEPLRLGSGLPIDGVLGMDFLIRYAIELDFDNGFVRLYPSAPTTWKSEEEPIPMKLLGGRPFVAATVGRRIEPFVVDTGANKSHIRAEAFDAMVGEGYLIPSGSYRGVTLGAASAAQSASSIGSHSGRLHTTVRLDRDLVSGLGLQYLRRYRMRFDFPNEIAYFRPGNDYSSPERIATSGMRLVRVNGLKTVVSIESGSAAEEAGIQAGDVLVSIDGLPAKTLEMYDLWSRLTVEPNRKIALEIARGGGVTPVTVILKSRLPSASVSHQSK